MVHRLLISGDETQLYNFHMVAFRCNPIDRREQTMFFTCFAEDFDEAKKVATKEGVTMQEIVLKYADGVVHTSPRPPEREDDALWEHYEMIVQGEHPGWKAPE